MSPEPRGSRALAALPPYPMAHIPRRRRALEAAGVDVVDLGAGDSDGAPPPMAVEALRAAVLDPRFSRYPFQLGHVPFREAVAGFMEERFGVRVDPMEEVLPLIGSKEGIAHLSRALLDPGDVAIIPDPGYQAYRGGVTLAGAEPVALPLRPEDDFLLEPERLSADVLRRARLLLLNYPNNPTTATAPRAYLARMVDFCREHGLVLAHDLAYSEIAFDGYRPPSVLEVPGAREVAVEFHSLSKSFNMTGWRLGWMTGAPALVALLSRLKTFVDTGAFLAVQEAGRAALAHRHDWLPDNVEVFRQRRDVAVRAFRAAGFDAVAPRATMYLWVPVPEGLTSEAFALRALEEAGVVVLPGSALGAGGEGFFRVALTVDGTRLEEAASRLGRAGLA